MNPLRLIGIFLSITLLLASCSQKISKLDFDRQVYEYEQLKMRYDLLKKEVDKKGGETTTESTTEIANTVSLREYNNLKKQYDALLKQQAELEAAKAPGKTEVANVNIKEFNDLKQRYDALLKQQVALETAYEELRDEQYTTPTAATPPGSVPLSTYNEVKSENELLIAKYAALENRYALLKDVKSNGNNSTVNSAETTDQTKVDPTLNAGKGEMKLEATSMEIGSEIIQSTSFNGLLFDFDTYERTEDYLVLEVAVKNNSQTNLKTFWDAKKIQIIGNNNQVYTADTFRVGVDYANKSKTLNKRIKDEYTVFARFAFETLPENLNHVKQLSFTVDIDGEERTINLTHIDISKFEYE